jgi:hypothetical protein
MAVCAAHSIKWLNLGVMATDMFMLVDRTEGELATVNHVGYFDVQNLIWGVLYAVSISCGRAALSGLLAKRSL